MSSQIVSGSVVARRTERGPIQLIVRTFGPGELHRDRGTAVRHLDGAAARQPLTHLEQSRTMRSMAVRRPLFISVICLADSVALMASVIAAIVAPRITVVMAIVTSSSTRVKPCS